jgi:TPR repeat protein
MIKLKILLIALFSFIFLFIGIASSKAEISFLAMADSPYSNKAFFLIENELKNIPKNTKFIVHLGDMKHKDELCTQEDYQNFSELFKQSPIPVFTVPGDNDYSICENPTNAKLLWEKYVFQLEKYWKPKFSIKRQKAQKDNFAFLLEHALFIGIRHFEKRTTETNKFKKIMENNFLWIKENIEQYKNQIKTLVIFAHDFSGLRNQNLTYKVCGDIQFNSWEADQHYKYFSDKFVNLAQEFKKPILYLHGNHHCWHRDTPYKEAKNIERLVVSKIEKMPMARITVTNDKYVIDQRIDKRLNFFLKDANLGNSWSQYFLGSEYLKFEDNENAQKWLTKSAQQNFPPAQVSLGAIFQNNNKNEESAKKNYPKAVKLFESAIENEQLDKVFIKHLPDKAPPSFSYQNKIIQFQKKEMKDAIAKAYFALGVRYFKGLGTPPNQPKAIEYYKKASDGLGNASLNLASIYFNGLGVQKDLNEARKWYLKCSSHGVPHCRFKLGTIYLEGLGVPQDYKKAVKWFKIARNHPASLFNLGTLYFKGLGVNKDLKTAFNYFKIAAEKGSPNAKKVLEFFKSKNKK